MYYLNDSDVNLYPDPNHNQFLSVLVLMFGVHSTVALYL